MQPQPSPPHLRCPHCGHDVSAVATCRCPECGNTFDRVWLRHEASRPPPTFARLLILIFAIPVALSAWMIFTIWALDRLVGLVILPPAAGACAIMCAVNSAAVARSAAIWLQHRGVAPNASPRGLTVAAGFICAAAQLGVIAIATLVALRWAR